MLLNYITWNVDPEIFHIATHWGTLSVRWYGLMFAFAFLFGYIIFVRYLKTDWIKVEIQDELLIYIAVGTVVGARLGHCLFYEPEYFLKNPVEILKIWKGGLASHGGAIGILLAIWLFVRKYKMNFLWLMDRLVIVVALGGFFIRMGNLFNSEIYGGPTNLPWAFLFVRDHNFDPHTGALLPQLPSHPTQIYEALCYLTIFIILFIIYRKKFTVIRDGYIFGLFMIMLFTARFLIEFVKNDQVGFEAGMKLNMGQLLSLPFILAGGIMLYLTKKKPTYFTQKPVPKDFGVKKKKK